jgi:hypothetical protein
VSLASVVNVAITNAQRSLVELSVRLVNQSDAERKDALVKWSERTRHELMRVLVLARWLDAIPQVQRAWRVFGLLNDVDRTQCGKPRTCCLSRATPAQRAGAAL